MWGKVLPLPLGVGTFHLPHVSTASKPYSQPTWAEITTCLATHYLSPPPYVLLYMWKKISPLEKMWKSVDSGTAAKSYSAGVMVPLFSISIRHFYCYRHCSVRKSANRGSFRERPAMSKSHSLRRLLLFTEVGPYEAYLTTHNSHRWAVSSFPSQWWWYPEKKAWHTIEYRACYAWFTSIQLLLPAAGVDNSSQLSSPMKPKQSVQKKIRT